MYNFCFISKCTLQTPKKESAYALALANRSAVQMKFGKHGFKNAIADIERALKAGHPAPMKLLERKISCLVELGQSSQVKNLISAIKAS